MTLTASEPLGSANRLLVVICAATFFGVLNASAVNVVLPEIGTSYAVGPGLLGWVMSIFLLTYGVAIPFYGRLADRFGARRLFIFGLGLFGVGSLICAVAPGFETLLIARVIQGLGGAAFPGLGMTLASRAFPPERRGTALGYIAATMGIGAAVGPMVGGIAADLVSWRLLFFASALAIVVVPAARAVLPREDVEADASVDLTGGLLLAAGVASLLYAVSEGSRAGWTGAVLAATVITLGAFLLLSYQQSRASRPFIPHELVRSSAYRRAVTTAFCTTGSYLAALIGLPLLLTEFHSLNPSEIGMVLLPEAVLTAVTGVIAGRLVDRFGARAPTFVGAVTMVVVAVGLSSFAGNSVFAIVVLGGLLGAGYALINTPIATAISTIVEPRVLSSALSLNAMLFFIGGSFGITAFVTVAEARAGTAAVWNPLYSGAAASFSDAFLLFAIPMALAAALALSLPRRSASTDAESADSQTAREPESARLSVAGGDMKLSTP